MKIIKFIQNTYLGIIFVSLIAILSFVVADISYVKDLHLSVLIIGVIFGILFAKVFSRYSTYLTNGVNFSAKRLLRLGIVLFGFNVSLNGVIDLGGKGIIIALLIVALVFIAGSLIGTKILKLDGHTAMLVSAGSAVCGAAAVLALESVLKSQSHKSILAVASVVVFGLIGMFVFPLLLNTGIIALDDASKGIFLGAISHEVANVVGAAGSIASQDPVVMENALIVKMLRVILLVPLLLIIAFLLSSKQDGGKINVPWFAIFFLLAILIAYFVNIPSNILESIKIVSQVMLVFAMIALGLQIDLRKILQASKGILILSIILFIFLAILGYFLVKYI